MSGDTSANSTQQSSAGTQIQKVSVNASVKGGDKEINKATQEAINTMQRKIDELSCCVPPFEDALSHYLQDQFMNQKLIKRP